MKHVLSAFGAVLCLSSSVVYAHTSAAWQAGDSILDARDDHKFTIEVGDIVSYLYQEPGLIQIHGQLGQIELKYRRISNADLVKKWYDLSASFAMGTLEYDGGTQDIQTGAYTGSLTAYPSDSIAQVRGLAGVPLVATSISAFSLYAGLALWNLSDTSSGQGSYDRNITYFFAPVGLEYIHKFGMFTWTAAGEFEDFFFGIVRSDLSQVSSALPDTTNYQSSGLGGRLSTTIEMNFSALDLLLEARYQYWNIQESSSESVTLGSSTVYLTEPANNTSLFAVMLGLRF